jgi:uncharacterized membrane protein YbhN (UPF0104 family)
VLVAVAAAVLWTVRGRAAARVRSLLRGGLVDARTGLLARNSWPGVALLSAAALAGYLALLVVAARDAGAQAPVGQLLPLLMLALLVMGLPVNIGGWGPREAVSALAFGAAGLGAAQGLTAAVVYGVLSFIACLPGAVVLLLRRSARFAPAPLPIQQPRAVTDGRRTSPPALPAVPLPCVPTPAMACR